MAATEILTVIDILGGEETVHHSLDTSLDFSEVVREGLPKEALLSVQKKIGIPTRVLAKLVGTSERSLSRLKSSDDLSHAATESTLQIAEIAAKGLMIFGDESAFQKWLKTPNGAMDGTTPLSQMENRYGCRLVLDVLGRIEWGVYS